MRTHAFTLIELMISVALVLILILGVNQIFKYTTDAVGRGEAITDAQAKSRALEAAFSGDFDGLVKPGTGPTDSASLIISSRARYGFANAADFAAQGTHASDWVQLNSTVASDSSDTPNWEAAYQDMNGAGTVGDPNVPGDVTPPYHYNRRNHRLDVLSFFARGLFHRQTGNPGVFADNMASNEAWIWYGHGWLPDNSGAFTSSSGNASPPTFPCAGTHATNPNNFFGNQLVLCRRAILLTPAVNYPPTEILDANGAAQWYNDFNSGTDVMSPLGKYSPLTTANTTGSDPMTPPTKALASRVDLANTSIALYRNYLLGLILAGKLPSSPTWTQSLLDGEIDGRFQCNPYVGKPMTAMDMAYAAPYMLGGCSQFIVEYAGDYLTQDNIPSDTTYGAITGAGPDGQVDYTMVYDSSIGQYRKQIIWYGLPRKTGSGANFSIAASATNKDINNDGDVAPLAYWLAMAFGPSYTPTPSSSSSYYGTFESALPQFTGTALTTMEANSQYVCGFNTSNYINRPTAAGGPIAVSPPKLIRITLTIEDPTGRLPDGQTYQYVFQLP